MTLSEFYELVRYQYGSFYRALNSIRSQFTETKRIHNRLTIRRIF